MLVYLPSPESATNHRQRQASGKVCDCISRKVIERSGRSITLIELSHRSLGWLGYVPDTDTFAIADSGNMSQRVKLAWAMRLVAIKQAIIAKNKGGDAPILARKVGESEQTLPGNRRWSSCPSPVEELAIAAERTGIEAAIHRKACNEGQAMVAAKQNLGKIPLARALSREKHKKVIPVGKDVAIRHWQTVCADIVAGRMD